MYIRISKEGNRSKATCLLKILQYIQHYEQNFQNISIHYIFFLNKGKNIIHTYNICILAKTSKLSSRGYSTLS